MPRMQPRPQDTESITQILKFWLGTSLPPPADAQFRNYWFSSTAQQDEEMKSTFSSIHKKISEDDGLRAQWSSTREGRMALIILLDQLPRNMFLGSPDMFATDPLALPLALQMANDECLSSIEKVFVFLAIQHAENLEYAVMSET